MPQGAKTSEKRKPSPPKNPERMSIYERVDLGARVVAARHKPKPDTWPVIAKREGKALRVVQRAYADYVAARRKHHDPTGDAVIDETLHMYEGLIEWLAAAMEDADIWPAKLGASRQLMEALTNRIDLLVATGKMPRSIQAATDRQRAQILIRRMAEVLERRGAPPEMVRELLEILDEDEQLAAGPRELEAGTAA
jgi:hypothetical protein